VRLFEIKLNRRKVNDITLHNNFQTCFIYPSSAQLSSSWVIIRIIDSYYLWSGFPPFSLPYHFRVVILLLYIPQSLASFSQTANLSSLAISILLFSSRPNRFLWPFRAPQLLDMDFLHNHDVDHHELFDSWTCAGCFRTISAERPPNLNLDNCSCSEAGTAVNDPDLHHQINGVHGHGSDEQKSPSSRIPNSPSSDTASDDGSVRGPEGPEARDPNNPYPLLAPEVGLGELQHRRRSSFDDDLSNSLLSFPLRRYLMTASPLERSFDNLQIAEAQQYWLRQDTYVTGPTFSTRANKGSSVPSMQSSNHSGLSWRSWRIDPTNGVGTWMEDGGRGEWPMVIDEHAIEEE